MGMTYSWITQPACVSANRITDDIAAVRMNETVEPLLAQQTGIVTGLDETQRTVQMLVPKSASRSIRGQNSRANSRDAQPYIMFGLLDWLPGNANGVALK